MPQEPIPEPITPGSVTDRPWALDRAEGPRVAPFLALLSDGRIGGSGHRSAISWHLYGGCLQFFDGNGLPTASFRRETADGCLHGTSTIHGPVVLRPLARAVPTAPRPGRSVRRRRNLVLLRAGPKSLHPFWTRDIADADRNWDLCLSWYGDPAARPESCEYFFAAAGTKFEGLAQFLAAESLAWDYEHVWMPDDDLMTGWADINRLFALCAEYDLMLAQPSLAKGCFINHRITEQDPRALMRFCSFVEIMAPVFSHRALLLCAPTFATSRSGYGLDHIWPRLIGAPPNRIAIIDAVSVVHTRPIGASYELGQAMAEGGAVEDAYGVIRRYQVFGYVMVEPHGVVRLRDEASGNLIYLSGDAAREVCA